MDFWNPYGSLGPFGTSFGMPRNPYGIPRKAYGIPGFPQVSCGIYGVHPQRCFPTSGFPAGIPRDPFLESLGMPRFLLLCSHFKSPESKAAFHDICLFRNSYKEMKPSLLNSSLEEASKMIFSLQYFLLESLKGSKSEGPYKKTSKQGS